MGIKMWLALLFTALTIITKAQGNKIAGKLTDTRNMPIAAATVTLQNIPDTAIIKTGVTNNNGQFVFKNITAGDYIVSAVSMGYNKYVTGTIKVNNNTAVVLPTIVLAAAGSISLKEITVISNKPLTERKIDRTIVNVDAMISAAGSNVLEVLGKSPGVTVDINGGISLYGVGGVLVLIDDRQTYMSGQDLAAYLRSLPGSMVDKIELMSNPPAKYDASGSAVINIMLKKNRVAGFNGNMALGFNQGIYSRTNNSINFNYRAKKMNIFGNIGYSEDRNFNDETLSRYYTNPGGAPGGTLQMNSQYKNTSRGVNARAGIDYFHSKNTTFGILLTVGTRPRDDNRSFNTLEYDAGMALDSTASGSTSGKYQWHNVGANINFQHSFDRTGKEIKADFDYIHYYSNGNQFSPTAVYLPGNILSSYTQLLNITPANVNIWSAKADYTQPFAKNARLDAGVKSSYVVTNDESNWFAGNGAALTPDYGKTNHFIYRENINAAYISATKNWKRLSLQGGLRAENTIANGRQLGNTVVAASKFTLSNTIVFPTAYILYKLDSSGSNTLAFSYGVRIRRPNYQQLNPFITYRDKYSFSAGNPFLDPAFNHVFELDYTYKSVFGVSLAYLHIRNDMYNLAQVVGDTIFTRPQNFGTDYSFNLRPYISVSPLKWWHLDADVLLFHLVHRGTAYGNVIHNSITAGELEINNQFRFAKGWVAELNGFFPARQGGAQTITDGFWRLDAGIQKSLFNSKASLRLTVNDMFHSVKLHDKTTLPGEMTAYHSTVSDTRRIGFSFNYRFGKQANARKRDHNTGGAEDVQGRVN